MAGRAPQTGGNVDEQFWDQKYGEQGRLWSGDPNGALVAEAGDLPPAMPLTSAAVRAGMRTGSPCRAGLLPAWTCPVSQSSVPARYAGANPWNCVSRT